MPFNLLVQLGILAVTYITSNLLAKRAQIPPSAPGSLEPPTNSIGRSIPIVWGTCKVQPNVVYFELPAKYPYTRDGQFAGYTYHAEMALGICWGPIDALQDIIFDNTRSLRRLQDFAPTDPVTPPFPRLLPGTGARDELFINALELFDSGGGGATAGGVGGLMDMMYGREDQDVHYLLEARVLDLDDPYLHSAQSAWPRLAYAVFTDNGPLTPPSSGSRGFYFGTTPTAKPIHFVVQRFPSGANGPDTATIEVASDSYEETDAYAGANPAEMIYEILTDDWWGLNINPSKIDLASFQAAAQTLFDESFGLSMQVDSAHPADETIADILRYIEGVVFTHPTTQLITLNLIRADFDVDAIPKITPHNSSDLEFYRPSFRELATKVKVRYTNNSGRLFTEDYAEWSNGANLEITGEQKVETADFPCILDPELAKRVAFREAKQLTLPFGRGSFKCDRTAFDFVKGTPFELTWPEEEIGPMVCRVLGVDRGELEDGKITISFAEDVFFVEPDGIVSGTVGTGGAPPPSSGNSGDYYDEEVVEIVVDGGTP